MTFWSLVIYSLYIWATLFININKTYQKKLNHHYILLNGSSFPTHEYPCLRIIYKNTIMSIIVRFLTCTVSYIRRFRTSGEEDRVHIIALVDTIDIYIPNLKLPEELASQKFETVLEFA